MDPLALYYAMYDLRVASESGGDVPVDAIDRDILETLWVRGLVEFRNRRVVLTDLGYNTVDWMYAEAGLFVLGRPQVRVVDDLEV